MESSEEGPNWGDVVVLEPGFFPLRKAPSMPNGSRCFLFAYSLALKPKQGSEPSPISRWQVGPLLDQSHADVRLGWEASPLCQWALIGRNPDRRRTTKRLLLEGDLLYWLGSGSRGSGGETGLAGLICAQDTHGGCCGRQA